MKGFSLDLVLVTPPDRPPPIKSVDFLHPPTRKLLAVVINPVST